MEWYNDFFIKQDEIGFGELGHTVFLSSHNYLGIKWRSEKG